MSLKSWVDEHPIPVAIGIAISTASATGGVAQYFHGQSVERLERENSIYTKQLEARLSGIERRIGSGEQTFFDVSRLVIPASSVRSLGEEFRNLAEGSVFADVPNDGGWNYSLTSERELMAAMFPPEIVASIPSVPMLTERNIHLWRGAGSYRVPTTVGTHLTFTPMVFVQVVDNERLSGAVAQLATSLQDSSAAAASPELNGGPIQPRSDNVGAVEETRLRSRAEAERELSNLFRGNIALMFLNGVAQSNLMLGMFITNARSDVTAVEKRGNVLYCQSRLTVGRSGEGANAIGPVVLVAETFVVTMPTKTVLVRSLIPSPDGRSPAFPWVTRFLAGLRIPLEAA